jgi:hypothetical protein
MGSGPAAGRLPMAVRRNGRAHSAARLGPVFTEMTSAFATPAR